MVDGSVLGGIGLDGVKKLRIVSREMPADLETPVSAFMKLQSAGAKILLESVESATVLGRYSFIGMKPDSRIEIDANQLVIRNGTKDLVIPHSEDHSPLESLRTILNRFSLEKSPFQPGLLGGAVGYISYDMVRFFERIPDLSTDGLKLPLGMFHLVDTLLVFDHIRRNMTIMCLTDSSDDSDARVKIDRMRDALAAPLDTRVHSTAVQPGESPKSSFTEDAFCAAVLDVKKHIVAGDVYQQVISQRKHGTTEAEPFAIYRALRMLNPSPYMYFLDFDSLKIIGSSPEALVKLEDGVASVRPIAGTRPRGKNEEEDKALCQDLINDEKERAEHVMLVDLGRNDLGQCCQVGSVKVTDFMNFEKYSHVIHLTSNVVGKLNPGMDQFDLFRSTFPAGTVTGAPKIRSMQLIEEIEKSRRGPYAGAVGYFSLSGDMDWCINIRSITMKGKDYYLQAGAGIVADSVPEREYQETLDKIAAPGKAIELAERGL